MPELPEVQTVCDVIGPQIKGQRIVGIRICDETLLENTDEARLMQAVCGAAIRDTARRGKYILFTLDNGFRLTVHLRMTGCLLVAPKEYPAQRHTRAVIALENEQQLLFTDQRRFGRIWLTDAGETIQGIMRLGPEPFDERITPAYLKEKCGGARKIKDCLLDQGIIAGIGNIYSDEILFRAGIHPARCGCSLTDREYETLARQIPETMAFYVEKNSIDAPRYLQTGGREYQNTPYLQVYGRAGLACAKCRGMLKKHRIAGRSSVYCPTCQPLDEKG